MKIKTSELIGAALDWAVAKCEGYNVGVLTHTEILAFQLKGETDPERIASIKELFVNAPAEACFISEDGNKHTVSCKLYAETRCSTMRHSTNWAQGGPIIEREQLQINAAHHNDSCAVEPMAPKYGFTESVGWHWEAYVLNDRNIDETHHCLGQTPLIAAMRCYVASKVGDEVDVPKELI